jgi:hypothetical protein
MRQIYLGTKSKSPTDAKQMKAFLQASKVQGNGNRNGHLKIHGVTNGWRMAWEASGELSRVDIHL